MPQDAAFPSPTLALIPVRMFLGLGWMRSGVEKLISSEWWQGDTVAAFLIEQRPHALPPVRPLVDTVLAPMATPISTIVLACQIAVAVALLSGRRTRLALRVGILMNVSFILMGSVNPSAFYVVMQLALLLGLALHEDVLYEDEDRSAAGRDAMRTAGYAAAAVLPLSPLIRTLHPAEVIEDPAIMLITLALLAAGSQALRWTLLTHADVAARARSLGDWLS